MFGSAAEAKARADAASKGHGNATGQSKDRKDWRGKEPTKDTSNSYDSRLRNPKYTKGKTKSYKATPENLLKVGTTILGGAVMPGVGIGVGPVVADQMGMGFSDPTGTVDSFSYDGKNQPDQVKPTVEEKKKKRKPTDTLSGLVGTLLDGAGGNLVLGN